MSIGRYLRWAPLAVAVFTIPLTVVAPSASADTAQALHRCQHDHDGIGFNRSVRFQLEGKTNPGVFIGMSDLRPGNVVRITGSGRVHYGGFLGLAGEWGPEGNGHIVDMQDRGWNYPNASEYSVAAWWNPLGNVPAALVRFNTCYVIPSGGVGPQWLLVGVNDVKGVETFEDNRGSYQIGVRVYCANTPTCA